MLQFVSLLQSHQINEFQLLCDNILSGCCSEMISIHICCTYFPLETTFSISVVQYHTRKSPLRKPTDVIQNCVHSFVCVLKFNSVTRTPSILRGSSHRFPGISLVVTVSSHTLLLLCKQLIASHHSYNSEIFTILHKLNNATDKLCCRLRLLVVNCLESFQLVHILIKHSLLLLNSMYSCIAVYLATHLLKDI